MLVNDVAMFEVKEKIASWEAWFIHLQLEFAVKLVECSTMGEMQVMHIHFRKRIEAAKLDMEGDAKRIAHTSSIAIVLDSLIWHMCCAAKENISIQLQKAYLNR